MTNALWQPQAHMASVLADDRMTIVSGEGANITTADGRTLLDATAGLWHANIGHGRPELAEAAAAQMRTLETYHTFGRIANDQALALADRLEAMSPIADAKVVLRQRRLGRDRHRRQARAAATGSTWARPTSGSSSAATTPTTGCTRSAPASPGSRSTARDTARSR